MLDIVAALRWVRDNIAVFGGDPGNVTIFGHSGGGAKVSALLAMPAVKNLFHRAIIQSGVEPSLRSVEEASRQTDAVMRQLDIPPARFRELAELPVERIIGAAQGAGGSQMPGAAYWPVLDGVNFRNQPLDAAAAGDGADVPIVIGTASQEASVRLEFDDVTGALRCDDCWAGLPETLGRRGFEVMGHYQRARPLASELDLYVEILTDWVRVPSIWLAEARSSISDSPVFMYQVAFPHPVAGGVYGAMHGVEWPLVFDNCAFSPAMASDEAARHVAGVMSSSWASFARTGNPNVTELPFWDPYRPPQRATMIFDVNARVISDPQPHGRHAWLREELRDAGLVSRTPRGAAASHG
jgi:para-nitrobenzyl esterase